MKKKEREKRFASAASRTVISYRHTDRASDLNVDKLLNSRGGHDFRCRIFIVLIRHERQRETPPSSC